MVTVNRYDSLNGQTAPVSGATRGIGEQIAAQFTELGTMGFASARDTADVESGGRYPLELDVTAEMAMKRAIDRIGAETGRLDIPVNNAGVAGPKAPLHEADTAGINSSPKAKRVER